MRRYPSPKRSRAACALPFFVVLTLALPEVATAGELRLANAEFTFQDAGSERNTLQLNALPAGALQFWDQATPITLHASAAGACTALDAHRIQCANVALRTVVLLGGNPPGGSQQDGLFVDFRDAGAVDNWPMPIRASGQQGDDRIEGGDFADTLDGGDGDDTIRGGAGADVIAGGAGDDILHGGREIAPVSVEPDGGDAIDGGPGADRLFGHDGPDLLDGGSGADPIDGGAGADTVTYAAAAGPVTVTLNAGAGDDGGASDAGPGGRDSVGLVEHATGSGAGDVLIGDGGANRLAGGGGDDLLRGAGGADVLEGGGGLDTATYDDHGGGVTATLDGLANDGSPGESDQVGGDVENLAGGPGADVLTGHDGANVLFGGDGNDTLTGLGGPDSLLAGGGDDTLHARDQTADAVDCGTGSDGGDADAGDVLVACEIPFPQPDRDGDGFPADVDCDDANARVHPGARERRGNRGDENCDGVRAPYLRIDNRVEAFWAVFATHTRVDTLTVLKPRKRMVITLRCAGGGRRSCPFERRAFRIRRNAPRKRLASAFRNRRLAPGTKLSVRITAPRRVGKQVVYTMRRRVRPKVETLCVPPGRRARRC